MLMGSVIRELSEKCVSEGFCLFRFGETFYKTLSEGIECRPVRVLRGTTSELENWMLPVHV